ncbi:ATP-binding protein [Gluconobacter japonicus]|uniref:ATP-binding protein n=1 Tax=Gluconobacter japonicus TaxID=376620 RepID=UPI0024AD530E|nr:ATP-binding protein [Gluconobacter japonicus]MDI6653171.1 ATP-binding protein [Gluconobacter japonicus]
MSQAYQPTALRSLHLKLTDLGALVQEIVRIFTARWKGCVTLDVIVPSNRIMVRLDAVQMEQTLLNLLNNGAEAALEQPDPHVQLVVKTANNAITICVRDNGPGIDVALREKIFEPLRYNYNIFRKEKQLCAHHLR